MKKSILFLVIASAALSFTIGINVSAHEPRLVLDDQLVLIKNPEVSQAFYGELKNQPAYYLIDLKKAGNLYFQILAPDLPEIKKDKTVTVDYISDLGRSAAPGAKVEGNFAVVDPGPSVWQSFYEEYAGDNYFAGPSVKRPAIPGYYIVKITSPDNTGKYVLVVGDKEEFSAPEMVKALITIPKLKTKFFNQPVWQSFNGKIGKYFGLGLAIIIILFYLFHKFRKIYK
jgi:hypothetical protein